MKCKHKRVEKLIFIRKDWIFVGFIFRDNLRTETLICLDCGKEWVLEVLEE